LHRQTASRNAARIPGAQDAGAANSFPGYWFLVTPQTALPRDGRRAEEDADARQAATETGGQAIRWQRQPFHGRIGDQAMVATKLCDRRAADRAELAQATTVAMGEAAPV
jgi:hypothetical protein